MAWLLNHESGEVQDVPEEQATSAVASGKFALPKGRIPVMSPDGTTGTIDAAEAPIAFAQQGFRLLTPDELQERSDVKEYGDSPIQAGLEGVARGLTVGLSDKLLTATGAESPRAMEQRQKRNETAATVGELGGAAASLLIPGVDEISGPALAAKAGKAVEGLVAPALGKVAGKLLSAGAEGSIWGAGHAVSEAALGDTDLTAEKLVSNAGVGFLLGAAGGALGHAIDLGVSKGIQKAGELLPEGEGLQDALRGMAERRQLKGAGAIQSDLKKLSEGQQQRVGRAMLDRDVPAWASVEERLADSVAAKKEASDAIGEVISKADEASGGKFDFQSAIDRAEKYFDGLNPSQKRLAGEALKAVEDLKAAQAQGGGFQLANEIKSTLYDGINFTDNKVKSRITQKTVGILKDEIENQVAAVSGKDAAQALVDANTKFGAFSDAVKMGQKGVNRQVGNRAISLSDYMTGDALGLLHGGPVGMVTGLAGAVGHKVLRERGSQIAAKLIDTIAESPMLAKVADAFQGAIQKATTATPDLFGAYGSALANAAARGPADLLATHISLAQTDPQYRDTMATAGFPAEGPDQAGLPGRIQKIAGIQQVVDSHDARVDAATSRFLGKQGGAAPGATLLQGGSREERLKNFQDTYQKLTDLAADPNGLAEALTPGQNLADAAPSVAAAATATANRAVQFLLSKAPKNPDPQVVPALQRDWKPSDSELARWERYMGAVNDPQAVLADLRNGTVTREATEALQTVYPKLLSDIQQRMMERIGTYDGKLSYKQKLALSTLFNAPVGDVGRPATIAAIQQAHAQAAAAQAQQEARQRQVKFTNSLATQSQAVEGKR